MRKNLFRLRVFYHAAQIHHADRIGDMFHNRKIMGDKQVGQSKLLLELPEQVDDLRLDRHIQRGNRLVADNEIRSKRQRPGDADSLPLPARELMGIPLLIVGGQTADVHNAGDIAVKFFRRDDPVLAHRWVGVADLGGTTAIQHSDSLKSDLSAVEADMEAARERCRSWGGIEQKQGDVSFIVPLFDFFPVWLQFWAGEEELGIGAKLNCLWDANTLDFMFYETTWYARGFLQARLLGRTAE